MDEYAILYRNYVILKRIYAKDNNCSVKRPIFPLIHFIYNNNNYVKVSDIVNEFHFTKGRITQILNSLVSDDLVTKHLENNSRKQTFISLTAKGIDYYTENEPIMRKKAQNLADYMGEDLKEFNRLIEKLLNYEEEEENEKNN